MTDIKIIIHDRHPLFRQGLASALGGALGAPECREVGSFEELLDDLDDGAAPDLILYELWPHGPSGTVSHNYLRINYLRGRYARIPLLVISEVDDPAVIACCMELGAAGYVPKSQPAETVRKAVTVVLGGRNWLPVPVRRDRAEVRELTGLARCLRQLTPQESRVMMLLYEGLFNRQIADELSLTEATVKAHVSNILHKFAVPKRTNAILTMQRLETASA